MPQIYHAAPRCGVRRVPLVLSLLVEDEGQALRRVFLEYRARGETHALRLLPTDGYKGEDHYSLYSVRVPAEDLDAERVSYCFSVEGAYTRTYEFPLDPSENSFDEDVQIPALLPLAPYESFYLSRGDLCLCYLSFPWNMVQTRVFVREGGAWRDYAAALNERGEWECVLPASLLSKLGGRLIYFVEVEGECGAALLGSESEPLSMRLIDDAGPLLVSVCPADGETVAKNPPEIRLEYRDASGLDLRASAVYLDGRSTGENAIWTANGMSFCPETPLECGEHVLEIALRDTRGNRTYRRISFLVQGEEGADSTPPKKPMSAVRAAGFFWGALATLKKLFSNKE